MSGRVRCTNGQRARSGASHGCNWDQHGIFIVFTLTGRRGGGEFPARGEGMNIGKKTLREPAVNSQRL